MGLYKPYLNGRLIIGFATCNMFAYLDNKNVELQNAIPGSCLSNGWSSSVGFWPQLQSEWIEACDKSEKLIVNMFRYMHQHIPSGKLT